jgi:iron-sulfur cluster assembly accessory protein
MTLLQIQPAGSETGPTLPMPVQITEKAAEMVKSAMEQEELIDHGLRVGVTGGGCSGLQYLLDFAEKPREIDFSEHQHGVEVFIDPFSAAHLNGTIIDYVDSLTGSGFKFENPNIVRSCGCGSSFQT